jgi:hypothetical protein
MAEALGTIGFPAFVVASLVLGVRLLALARRTRKLPELAIGLNFILGGAIGYSLLIAAESLHLFPDSIAGWGSFGGVLGLLLGAASICVFTRQVFRPESRGSLALLGAFGVWTALALYGSFVLHVSHAPEPTSRWLGSWGPNLGLLAAYAWSSFEPLRYHALLRRRARLGLADAQVANRLWLWGCGTLATLAIALLHFAAQLAGRHELPPSWVGASAVLILATAACQWLAFFPPAAYRRRFAAR